MKITIENFGPISHFSIDLKKDFNLFVGKNSVGKSYASTVVYLILKSLLNNRQYPAPFNYLLFEKRKGLNFNLSQNEVLSDCFKSRDTLFKLYKHLAPGKEEDITDLLLMDFRYLFSPFCTAFSDSLKGTYHSLSNLENHFTEKSPIITLENEMFRMDVSLLKFGFEITKVKFHEKIFLEEMGTSTKLKTNKKYMTLAFGGRNGKRTEKAFQKRMSNHIIQLMNDFLRGTKKVVGNIHYLPAGRSGLSQALGAFGAIFAELSTHRSHLTKKIEVPGISEPSGDYFLELSSISPNGEVVSGNKKILKIARDIEKTILNGEVRFDIDTKQLKFTPKRTKLDLDLSVTSSMVSEVSPIVAYLRHIISQDVPASEKGSHLIIIEEPEAHLHPEIQVKLCQIFSQLIKAQVKLLITTHSNYVFNKINNLIMSKDIDVDAINIEMFKQTNKGSKLQSLDLNEFGAEDDNFAETISSLFDEKMEIVDSMNCDEDDSEC